MEKSFRENSAVLILKGIKILKLTLKSLTKIARNLILREIIFSLETLITDRISFYLMETVLEPGRYFIIFKTIYAKYN